MGEKEIKILRKLIQNTSKTKSEVKNNNRFERFSIHLLIKSIVLEPIC